MLKNLLTALNDCVWAFDVDKQEYLFISPSIEAVTGYQPKDFQQDTGLWGKMIDQRDRDNILTTSPSNNTGKWLEQNYRIVTKTGEIKRVRQKTSFLIDDHNGHQIILSVIDDVSALQQDDDNHEKQVQEEIVWTKNNLESLINNTEDLTWSVNRDGKYVYMNNAYQKRIQDLMGILPKEGDDANIYSGTTEEIREEWRSYYERAFLGERYITRQEIFDPETKETAFFEVSFNPIYRGQKDVIVGVGCFARNITERLKTEDALIEQNERLKNIASLSSHELRRPVASMMGLLNILDRENFSNPENEQIMNHMLTVTNEIDEVIRLIVNKTFIDNRFSL